MDQQKPFIVIVDDDDEHRYLLHCCFTELELHHNVKFFEDALQFVTYAKMLSSVNVRPSLFILDYSIPHISGTALVSFLKEDAFLQGVPVVILSNTLTPEIREKMEEVGAAACYQKGGNFQALVSDIREIVAFAAPVAD
jgi:CheY-like chemotaxis protein